MCVGARKTGITPLFPRSFLKQTFRAIANEKSLSIITSGPGPPCIPKGPADPEPPYEFKDTGPHYASVKNLQTCCLWGELKCNDTPNRSAISTSHQSLFQSEAKCEIFMAICSNFNMNEN